MPAQGAEVDDAADSLVVGGGVIGLSLRLAGGAGRLAVTVARPGARARGVVGGGRHARAGHRGVAGRGGAAGARRRVAAPLAATSRPSSPTPPDARPGCARDGTVVAATGAGDRAELDTLAA